MAKQVYSVAKGTRGVAKTLCVLSLLSLPMSVGATTSEEIAQEHAVSVSTLTQQRNTKRTKVIGVVIEAKTKDPIPGASVRIKGAEARGASTDLDGKFEIEVSPNDVLIVSSLSFAPQEVRVGKDKVLRIALNEDASQLEQLVVTAFGTGQKKETVTGAIQTVRPGDLKVPASNLSSAFAGRVGGMIAYQRSGEPGSNAANFFVRGAATMNGLQSPLILLDGVAVSAGDLNALDPEVIESFSVLKDASATALYGARGANGVLIIKTKSGIAADRPIIGIRLESYMNTPINVPKTVGAVDFMRLYNEAISNYSNGAIPYSREQIEGTINGIDPIKYPNVDWYKEMFRDHTWNQRANLNVRGGTEKITYFMNLSANHETGMLRGRSKDFYSYDNNIDYMKYAFQNNIDFNISPASKLALHLNVQLNNYRGPITGGNGGGGVNDMFDAIMNVNPVDFPITYPKGDDEWIHWGAAEIGSSPISNPLAVATSGYKEIFASTVVANLNYDHKLDFITKGLAFKALFSFKNWSSTNIFRFQGTNKYRLSSTEVGPDGKTIYKQAEIGTAVKHTLSTNSNVSGDRSFYLQALLNYDRTFGGVHNVGAMLVADASDFSVNVIGGANDGLRLINSLPRRRMGMAVRASYDYARKYLLEVNVGYSGSENFASGHRWGVFPSVSAGWNVSQEDFWKPVKKVVSNFKLRGSYGLVGNDNIGGARFVYLPQITLGNSAAYSTGFGEDSNRVTRRGPTFSRLKNNEITWEIARKLNLGADMELFNSLKLVAEVFHEHRNNIFQQKASIPKLLGADGTTIWGNFGELEIRGLELSAEYGKQINKDLSISARGNFTFARNKILKTEESPGLRPALSQVGKRLNVPRLYVADGLYIDEADIANSAKSTLGNIAIAPGDIKFLDQPNREGEYDGKIDADDRIHYGHPVVPEIVYGFGASVNWKNWDASVFFQGQSNVSLVMSGFAPFGNQNRRQVLQWIADDHWSKDNQNIRARHPRLTQTDNNHNMQGSTFWLRDASFLRFKNAEIGYKFKFARLYVSATNLLTFAPFKLWDPEMGGGRGMSYPLQRTINFGLQMTFK